MKKIIICMILLIGFITLATVRVEAKKIDSQPAYSFAGGSGSGSGSGSGGGSGASCGGFLTEDAVDIIREILGYFRILGPILLIVFVALDFGAAVIAQDNDAMKKAQKKVTSRAIATGLLFFVPTIIRAILGLDGIKQSIVISDDPLCHVLSGQPVEIVYKDNI